jgi:hypothetical protein
MSSSNSQISKSCYWWNIKKIDNNNKKNDNINDNIIISDENSQISKSCYWWNIKKIDNNNKKNNYQNDNIILTDKEFMKRKKLEKREKGMLSRVEYNIKNREGAFINSVKIWLNKGLTEEQIKKKRYFCSFPKRYWDLVKFPKQ